MSVQGEVSRDGFGRSAPGRRGWAAGDATMVKLGGDLLMLLVLYIRERNRGGRGGEGHLAARIFLMSLEASGGRIGRILVTVGHGRPEAVRRRGWLVDAHSGTSIFHVRPRGRPKRGG